MRYPLRFFGYLLRYSRRYAGVFVDRYGTLYYSSSGPSKPAYRTIIRLRNFERSARKLLSKDEERWIDNTLGADPEAGDVVPGTGGVRKLRVALLDRGKRGGARVIYYYSGAKEQVFLILAYAKTAKLNLTGSEKHRMQKLVAELESER